MKLAVSAESSEVNTAAPSIGALTLIVTGITQSGRSIRTFTLTIPGIPIERISITGAVPRRQGESPP